MVQVLIIEFIKNGETSYQAFVLLTFFSFITHKDLFTKKFNFVIRVHFLGLVTDLVKIETITFIRVIMKSEIYMNIL